MYVPAFCDWIRAPWWPHDPHPWHVYTLIPPELRLQAARRVRIKRALRLAETATEVK